MAEDDENLLVALQAALRGAAFAVDVASELMTADLALTTNSYDCVIFDRMLRRQDALFYVRDKRNNGWAVPVLFLTARDTLNDRLEGLRLGCDYLAKPFEMAEVVARVVALCRRNTAGQPVTLRCADVELDTGTREVRRAGVLLTLTPREFLVLQRLMASPGTPVSRKELIQFAWDEYAEPKANVLDVVIVQLRRKLREPHLIHAVRGVGYQIAE